MTLIVTSIYDGDAMLPPVVIVTARRASGATRRMDETNWLLIPASTETSPPATVPEILTGG